MTRRSTLERQLRELRTSLLDLGSLAERAISRAMQALAAGDLTLAQSVIDDDQGINKLRWQIEGQCDTLIATQQPMASDMREVVTALSLVSELERIADHAKGIARLTLRLHGLPMPPDLVGLPTLADEVRQLLRRALDAYVTRDTELAYAVVRQDDTVDHRYQAIFQALIQVMATDPALLTPATYLLWIAHNLERIGDRATNLAERVVFLVTGKLIERESHPLPRPAPTT